MKIVKWTSLGLAGLLAALVSFVLLSGDRKFHAPYPEIKAVTDPEIIARGEYLVFGPAHCATCHVPMDRIREVENGLKIPLTGGWEIDIPPATLRAPNLTPDRETGIGRLTDGEIARTLRYGVRHDGRYIMPVMPYAEMSDEDLTAIISYLRSQPAVKNHVPPTEYKFIGKALLAFGVLKPAEPANPPPPASVTRGETIEYGAYLARGIANCMGCHTEMDLMSGQFTKPPFAGGFYFEPDAFSEGYSFVSPNLTPHRGSGIMADWSEENFITRFKAGRVHKGTPMPWGAFSRMDTLELKALHRFLVSLEPVENPIATTVFPPGKAPK